MKTFWQEGFAEGINDSKKVKLRPSHGGMNAREIICIRITSFLGHLKEIALSLSFKDLKMVI